MTLLLDVNILVALLDLDHIYHKRADAWFESEALTGWATCPLTENGAVRILGHPRYPNGAGTPGAAAALLADLLSKPGHEFWADEISIIGSDCLDVDAIGASAHVTDAYLLALAVSKGGMLATLDRRLSPRAVRGGSAALRLVAQG